MKDEVREAFRPVWHSIFHNPFYFTRRGLYKAIRKNASYINGKTMDFGCGSKPYKSMFGVTSYIGVEYDTELSRKNTTLENDIYYDGKTLPFSDGHFDSAFSTEVLEHIFNPDEILPEINRVLKPGGYFLFTCPFMWPEHEQPYDFARYTSFALKHLMQKHGFEVQDYQKTGSYLEVMFQSLILYLFFFIPKRPAVLKYVFFTVFITPFILLGSLLSAVLPGRIKRYDLYHNNVMLAKKI